MRLLLYLRSRLGGISLFREFGRSGDVQREE